MQISLGFSPCPNDTYIFDALVNKKIDTEGLEFNYFLADVEELNNQAFQQKADVTKLSFNAFMHLAGIYKMLDAGAALGFGAGPLVIAKKAFSLDEIPGKVIAIPGKNTTANLLFSIAFGEEVVKKEYLFSDIENAILNEEVDAGVVIHENRFTYAQKGLHKIIDLGHYWEQLTHAPVPLGGIAVHHRIDNVTAKKIGRLIRKSLEYANFNSKQLSSFVTCNAQEMDEKIMRSHIDLYVTSYSQSLGTEGRQAINIMFQVAYERGIIKQIPTNIFV